MGADWRLEKQTGLLTEGGVGWGGGGLSLGAWGGGEIPVAREHVLPSCDRMGCADISGVSRQCCISRVSTPWSALPAVKA